MNQEDNNKVVKLGMLMGAIVTPLLFFSLYSLLPRYDFEVELINRISLGIQCLVFPALFFLVTVVKVGSQRFGNPAEDPTKIVASSESMNIDLRVLSNTHEQLVIFSLNTLGLSITLPYIYLSLLPIYSAIFVAGRVIFWLAYRRNVLWRAPGFAMNILPAVVGLCYSGIVLILRVIPNT